MLSCLLCFIINDADADVDVDADELASEAVENRASANRRRWPHPVMLMETSNVIFDFLMKWWNGRREELGCKL